jgi:lipopolysaccharide export system protein LptA
VSRARLLRWLVLAALLPLAGLVVWQLVSRDSGGSGLRPGYEGPGRATTGLNRFEIHGTDEGRRAYRLRAEDLGIGTTGKQDFAGLDLLEIYREDGRTIRVTGQEGTLPHGFILPPGPQGEARVRIEGGVLLQEPGGPAVATSWLEFDRGRRLVWTEAPVHITLEEGYVAQAGGLEYRTDVRELTLLGGVVAFGQGEPAERLELRVPLVRYDITARRAEIPRSEAGGFVLKRGVERLSADHAIFDLAAPGESDDRAHLDGRVQGTVLPPEGGDDPVVFASGAAEARRAAAGGALRSMVLFQGARLWWRDESGQRNTLTAERIETELDEEGRLRSATARGDTELVLHSLEGSRRRISAPVLDAELEPGVSVTRVQARGGVRFEGDEGVTVRAGRAERDRDGRIRLRGEGENLPTILHAQRTVLAREIDVLPGGTVLLARGEVETSLVTGPGSGAAEGGLGPLFGPESPVQVRSASLSYDSQSGASLFEGEVRAVQEDRMLRAHLVRVSAGAERVEAEGEVGVRMFRIRDEDERVPVLVDSSRLLYSDQAQRFTFSGGVHYQEDPFSLKGRELEAVLSPEGGFSSAQAREDVVLEARGENEEGRKVDYQGFADTLDYDGAERVAVLHGRLEPARLVDRSTGEELAGPSLRLFLGEDRIVAEGEGRTTIRTRSPEIVP